MVWNEDTHCRTEDNGPVLPGNGNKQGANKVLLQILIQTSTTGRPVIRTIECKRLLHKVECKTVIIKVEQ